MRVGATRFWGDGARRILSEPRDLRADWRLPVSGGVARTGISKMRLETCKIARILCGTLGLANARPLTQQGSCTRAGRWR